MLSTVVAMLIWHCCQVPPGRLRTEMLLPPPEDPTKKCLVLDLDETLVHSSFQSVNPDAGISWFTIPVEIENSIHDINVIRRPGLDEFMRKVGALYEVVVFTASLAKVRHEHNAAHATAMSTAHPPTPWSRVQYANPVCDTIDTYNVIKHRLFREHCTFEDGNYVKVCPQPRLLHELASRSLTRVVTVNSGLGASGEGPEVDYHSRQQLHQLPVPATECDSMQQFHRRSQR
jgi:hypothetical protein